MRAPRIRFGCSLLILLLIWTTQVYAAEWYKEYEEGLEALRKGRPGDAVSKLQAAIAQKPQEGNNIKFYGMKFDDYYPHYYLGRALFQLKDYQGALNQLQISTRQGEIQRNKSLFQNLSELQTLATAQLKMNQPAPPVVAEKKPEPAQPPPQQVVEKKSEPEPQKEPEPVQVVRESSKTETPPVAKAEPPKSIEQPEPTEAELKEQRAKRMVRDGARKYFQGDLDAAIAALSEALSLSPDYQSAQFLIGCAYAAKYLLSGSSDEVSFKKASAAFQKTSQDHPLTRSRLISPAVMEIYRKVKGA